MVSADGPGRDRPSIGCRLHLTPALGRARRRPGPSGKKPSPSRPARRAAAALWPPTRIGMEGCTGLGWLRTAAERVKWAPAKDGSSSRQIIRRASMRLVGAGAALVGIDPHRLQLLPQPAHPDPEEQAPAGEPIDGGAALGQDQRVVLGEHQDSGAEPDPLGAAGQPGEQVERVGQLAVLRERHATGVAVGVAALVAHGHDDVLNGEQRLEAHLVGVGGEGAHPGGVAGHAEPVRRQEPEGDHVRRGFEGPQPGQEPIGRPPGAGSARGPPTPRRSTTGMTDSSHWA